VAGEKVELHETGSRWGPTPRRSTLFLTVSLKTLKECIDAIVVGVVLQGLGPAGLGGAKSSVFIIDIVLNKTVQLRLVMESDKMYAGDKTQRSQFVGKKCEQQSSRGKSLEHAKVRSLGKIITTNIDDDTGTPVDTSSVLDGVRFRPIVSAESGRQLWKPRARFL
jgi:hypothetical protein